MPPLYGLNDIWKKRWIVLLLMLQIYAFCHCLAPQLAIVPSYLDRHAVLSKYAQMSGFYLLTTIANQPAWTNDHGALVSFMGDMFDSGKALAIYECDEYMEKPTCYLFGDFGRVCPVAPGQNASTPYCLAGNGLGLQEGDIAQVRFFMQPGIPVAGTLDKAVYFPSINRTVSSDESLIIVMDWQQFANYHPIAWFFDCVVLIDPTPQTLQVTMKMLDSNGSSYVPISYRDYVENEFLTGASLQVLVFSLVSAAFLIVQVAVCVNSLVRANAREFCVHLAYGAPRSSVFLRVLFFSLTITMVPAGVFRCLESARFGLVDPANVPQAIFFASMAGVSMVAAVFAARVMLSDEFGIYFNRN